jgi:hypothetical protein
VPATAFKAKGDVGVIDVRNFVPFVLEEVSLEAKRK